MIRHRSTVALAVAAVFALGACTSSPPPGRELALEMVESLVVDERISESEADCMRDEIETFRLTEDQAAVFDDFDDVADSAAGNNELALQIMGDFQQALASCR